MENLISVLKNEHAVGKVLDLLPGLEQKIHNFGVRIFLVANFIILYFMLIFQSNLVKG